MHIPNPAQLNDDEWAESLQDLHYIRKSEKEASETN